MHRPPPRPTLFPYTTLFRSNEKKQGVELQDGCQTEPRTGAAVAASGGATPAEQRERQDEKLELADVEQAPQRGPGREGEARPADRKSTRLNSSHLGISYAVF